MEPNEVYGVDTVQTVIRPLRVADELEALASRPGRLLIDRHPYQVLVACGYEIPGTLLALGALRADAFRAMGEGDGEAFDLDEHDPHYWHIIVWNGDAHEIVGAYRYATARRDGRTMDGERLYTAELFEYDLPFFATVAPALELGRAFVHPRFQRSPESLLLLWQGIGAVLAKGPQVRHLFGAVSISKLYQPRSVELILSFLQTLPADDQGRVSVHGSARARRPVRFQRTLPPHEGGLRKIDAEVRALEGGRRGVPVLIHRYLELGGRFVAYHDDHVFNSIACLVVLDVDGLAPRSLARFMGKEAAETYRSYFRS